MEKTVYCLCVKSDDPRSEDLLEDPDTEERLEFDSTSDMFEFLDHGIDESIEDLADHWGVELDSLHIAQVKVIEETEIVSTFSFGKAMHEHNETVRNRYNDRMVTERQEMYLRLKKEFEP